jgi:Ca2+-binding RTX toxin-like protein
MRIAVLVLAILLLSATTLAAKSVYGTSGPDTLYGSPKADRIHSKASDDTIYPKAGDDRVHAGRGDDVIYARDRGGKDYIDCGPGRDAVETIHKDDVTLGNCERAWGPKKGDL